jgi:DNA-binding transcriptional LysR family regulator
MGVLRAQLDAQAFGHGESRMLGCAVCRVERIDVPDSTAYLRQRGRPASPDKLQSTAHRLIDFIDPETGRPFNWEFHQGRRRIGVPTRGQLIVNDVTTLHAACVEGYGIAQIMELGAEGLLAAGRPVELFPDWADVRFPQYALYPSRSHPPAKIRAFLDFLSAAAQQPSIAGVERRKR